MALKAFTTLNFPDQQINRFQDNVQNALSPVLASDIIGGSLLSGIAVVAGTPLVVNHGLGRTPIMCITALQDANSTIWATALNTNTLTLNASANVNVSIWVA